MESLIMRVNYASDSAGPLYSLERKVEQVCRLINTSSILLVVLAVMYYHGYVWKHWPVVCAEYSQAF